MIRPDRVQARLDALGLTPFSAARQAGLEAGYVRDILREKVKEPGATKMRALARVLQTSQAYLIGDVEEAINPTGVYTEGQLTAIVELPIRYTVAAGEWHAVDEQFDAPPQTMPVALLPRYATCKQWLAQVRGDSMDRLLPNGSFVHVIDAIDLGYIPADGDIVVVERRRAQGAFIEHSLKQVQIGPGGVELWPRSYNARWSEPLRLLDGVGENDDVDVTIIGKVAQGIMQF